MFTFFENQGHGESVYNLITPEYQCTKNPPMYRSRYSEYVRAEAENKKIGCTRTMGIPKHCLCPPDNYLKKHSRAPITIHPPGIPKVKLSVDRPNNECEESKGNECGDGINGPSCSENSPEEVSEAPAENGSQGCCKTCQPKCRIRVCCKTEPRPPVPKKCCCVLGIIPRGNRNFIRANAIKVVRTPARIPDQRFVCHPKGHTQEWASSGYPRRYVCKEDFGQIPQYLECVKAQVYQEDQDRKWKLGQPYRDSQKVNHLPNEERDTIVSGLKCKWEEVFKDYQSMPLLLDTAAHIKKRQELEMRLRELERHIQTFERHNHIFVGETEKSFYLA